MKPNLAVMKEETQGVLDLIEIAEDMALREAVEKGCDINDLVNEAGVPLMRELMFARVRAELNLMTINLMMDSGANEDAS